MEQIRAMLNSDWNQVAEIYEQGIKTNLATLQCSCPSFREWDESHLKECRLVIEEDQQIAGWAALTPVSGMCVYAGVAEVSIYVREDKKRNGYATKLLQELVKESENIGLWTLQSGIIQENIGSIALHEKCGFRMIGYREKLGRDPYGNWRNIVLMERRSPNIG